MPSVICFYLIISAPWSNQHNISLELKKIKWTGQEEFKTKKAINNSNG